MRTFIEKIQNTFAAVAFAEAGEHETAIQLAHGQAALRPERLSIGKQFANMIDRHFTAITYAEAGCNDMARQYLNGTPVAVRADRRRPVTLGEFARTVGLDRAPLHYGMAAV